MSTAAQSIDRIYTSGDVLLNNPVQWCVIFVAVILCSASMQYILAYLDVSITSKYPQMMVRTTEQEITVVGIVALCLMLATSFLPEDANQPLYAGIFSWTTMLVFFIALLYVMEMIFLYLVCAADIARWRRYEEGRLDTDDADRLVLRERHYRLAYDRFADELLLVFQIHPRVCPFHENCSVFYRRFLARMADFSFRCWLSLIVVTLLNFGRALYTPYASPSTTEERFFSAMVYMASTGWVVLFLFGVYCYLLFGSMSDLVNKRLKRSTVGAEIVPFWNPIRSVEYLQCTMLSLNYYMTVFILGIADTIEGTWQTAVVSICFVLPILIVLSAAPWVLWSLSIMSVLGSVKKNRSVVQRIVREAHGDYTNKSDEEDNELYSDLDDTEGAQGDAVMERLGKVGRRPGNNRRALTAKKPLFTDTEAQAQTKAMERPAWLDPEEVWDGKRAVLAAGVAGDHTRAGGVADASSAEFLYYNNVDGEDFDEVARRIAPELLSAAERSGLDALPTSPNNDVRGSTARSSDGGRVRPIWLDSDEEDKYDL